MSQLTFMLGFTCVKCCFIKCCMTEFVGILHNWSSFFFHVSCKLFTCAAQESPCFSRSFSVSHGSYWLCPLTSSAEVQKRRVLPITIAEFMTDPVRTIAVCVNMCFWTRISCWQPGLNVRLNFLVAGWFQSPVPSLWMYKYPQTFADFSVNKGQY